MNSVAAADDDRLALLLELERRVRACASTEELAFLLVNDAYALAPYRQAVLWRAQGDGGEIVALSGLSVPDPHAPFNTWLARLLAGHYAAGGPARALTPPDDADGAARWVEYLPAHAWWLPLDIGEGGALLLLRDSSWSARETKLMALFAEAGAHAWRALRPAGRHTLLYRLRHYASARRPRIYALLACIAVLCLPVRQSVLAPAEVVARQPVAIRAPLAGVVDRILVEPNQMVAAGDLLVALDAREIEGRLETARQTLAVTIAELRQGQQQALFDERSKALVAPLLGRRDQAAADVEFLERALARTQLRAERAGTVIFDDVADWIGKPVALGERIMQIADPGSVEIEAQLPIADAIALPPGAELRLFLNNAPARPLAATLTRIAYRAGTGADGTLAYRVRGSLASGATPRIGLKGTAKLYGERTALFVYLLRRPLAYARVWLGI